MAGASGAADNTETKEESSIRKKDLEVKIRRRVACEERAFRIVEKLIEGTITADYLIECVHFITPSHYTDITEERAIINLCGYPVCPNQLGKVLQQKFFISTKSNKVFDITERKNFCSNHCFKASKFFEKQISTSPVWSRELEQPRQLTLLDSYLNIGSSGFEVIGGNPRTIPDLVIDEEQEEDVTNETKTTSSVANSSSTSVNKTDRKSVTWASDNTCPSDRLTETFKEKLEIGDNSTDKPLSEENKMEKVASDCSLTLSDAKTADKVFKTENRKKLESEASSTMSKTEYLMQLLNKRKNLLSKMVDDQPPYEEENDINQKMLSHLKDDAQNLQIIERNVTGQEQNVGSIDNYSLNGQSTAAVGQKVVESNSTTSVAEFTGDINSAPPTSSRLTHDESKPSAKSSENLPSTVLTVYNRVSDWVTMATLYYLNILEKSDKKGDNYGDKNDSKFLIKKEDNTAVTPGPEESHPLRDTDFHTLHEQNKDYTIKVREFYKGSFAFQPAESATKDEEEEDTSSIILPPAESVAQLTMQRKIVLQKLERSLSDVLTPIGLAIQHIGTEVRQLVATFNLTSKNVLMKPDHWKLTSLFLIKMLEKKIPVVQESLSQGTSLRVFENLLFKYAISLKVLDESLQTIYKSKEIPAQDILDEN